MVSLMVSQELDHMDLGLHLDLQRFTVKLRYFISSQYRTNRRGTEKCSDGAVRQVKN